MTIPILGESLAEEVSTNIILKMAEQVIQEQQALIAGFGALLDFLKANAVCTPYDCGTDPSDTRDPKVNIIKVALPGCGCCGDSIPVPEELAAIAMAFL